MSSRRSENKAETLNALLAERIRAGDFPSAVYAVAERGEIVFSNALGDAARANDLTIPANIETIYDLASLTKPLVTGLLCALAFERKMIEPDAPVARYLDAFNVSDKRALTIRQMLTHASGLPAWRPLYALTNGEPQRALEAIAELPLECAPDSKVVYSDLGFIALGFLLEKIFGFSLNALAARAIFAPLALRRTMFNPPLNLREEIAASESQGNAHELTMTETQSKASDKLRKGLVWGEVHDGNAFFLGGAAGHAGLFSTAFETVRLAEQFISTRTRLLRPETCRLFQTNMTPNLNEARSFAWQLAATPDSTASAALPPDAFGHLGFTGTSCWIDARRERIYVLLTNRTHAHALPFVNINSTRRRFNALAAQLLDARDEEESNRE